MSLKMCVAVPADDKHMPEVEIFKKSLRKFHSEEELPILRFDNFLKDPMFWYRAKPIIAMELFKEGYDLVILADSDQIVTGDLSGIWNDVDYDAAVVWNDPTFPIQVWDIAPYFNNGLVALASKDFAEHWLNLCRSPHFDRYQYREQDILNILCSDYNRYKVRQLDTGPAIYGEFAKPIWAKATLKDNKVMLPYDDGEKELKVIHFGGGADSPDKGNINIRFSEEVVKHLKGLYE